MVDFNFLIQAFTGVAILAVIAILGSHWSTIVDFFSGEWARSMEKARAQKAAREQLYGYAVSSYGDSDPYDMSSDVDYDAVLAVLSKDGQNDGRTDSEQVGRAELLTLYKVLRKYGVPREEVRGALKGVRVPLSNDVWAQAQTAATQAEYVTPIVGRRTNAQFETDPEFPYQAPAT